MPVLDTADAGGGDIALSGTLNGSYVFTFNENTLAYTVSSQSIADSDGDGMPDDWETLHGFINGYYDADEDSDGDGATNLEEYLRGTDPNVFDALNSSYSSLSMAGDFNGWNEAANNMELVNHYLWRYRVGINMPAGTGFKFAANGSWTVNWGDNTPAGDPISTVPFNGIAALDAGNIPADGPLNGTYEIFFNEQTMEYSMTDAAVQDFDQDGVSDSWEQSHGLNFTNATDGAIDSDGEGLTNLEEFHNGTDPHDADSDNDGANDYEEVIAGTDSGNTNSILRSSGVTTGVLFQVTWPGANGREYDIQTRMGLTTGSWNAVPGMTNIPGVPGVMSETLNTSADEKRYYRIHVRLP